MEIYSYSNDCEYLFIDYIICLHLQLANKDKNMWFYKAIAGR